MGWWKQEVATKVVTNKVLNGGEQLPLSAFQHLALEAGLEYPRPPPPFEWQVPLAGLPSLGLKPERPRPSSRSLGGGPPGATWCTRSWMRELRGMTVSTKPAICRVETKPGLPSSAQAPPNAAQGEAAGVLCRPQRRGACGGGREMTGLRCASSRQCRGARGEAGPPALNAPA